MKKKIIISVLVVTICAILIAAAGKLQKGMDKNSIDDSNNKTETSEQSKKSNAEVAKNNSSNISASNAKNAQSSGSSASKQSSTQTAASNKNSNASASSNQTSNSKNQGQKPVQNLKPNFTVTNTVTGRTILSIHIDFSGGSAADATMKALDAHGISYRAQGMGDNIYFSAIGGLKERDAGPASGWCYYINGSKLGSSASKVSVGANDKIEWKFLKDGTTN